MLKQVEEFYIKGSVSQEAEVATQPEPAEVPQEQEPQSVFVPDQSNEQS